MAKAYKRRENSIMNTSALILMISVQLIVTLLTVWLFYRVLVSKPRPEPDSYSENDDIER
jgi:hypothetical protein